MREGRVEVYRVARSEDVLLAVYVHGNRTLKDKVELLPLMAYKVQGIVSVGSSVTIIGSISAVDIVGTRAK